MTELALTDEQKYEFDLRGYLVLRNHYDADAVARFHAGIDELQAIPVDYNEYQKLGISSYYLGPANRDPEHPYWKGGNRDDRAPNPKTGGIGRGDHAICGTARFDPIVRDPVLRAIHTELAGGPVYISATYYIEKVGPVRGGGLHNSGYPFMRDIYYRYDHTNGIFACQSTKSVVILSDMSLVENGPFAAIPGSHKANFACPHDMEDATQNPHCVPVLAATGDVVIFSEAMTHNAYPVTNDTIRRSVFFNYMPAIRVDHLPFQRMSQYPDHVLDRLSDASELLTLSGYI